MIPCKECLTLAICRTRTTINCSIVYDYLKKIREHPATKIPAFVRNWFKDTWLTDMIEFTKDDAQFTFFFTLFTHPTHTKGLNPMPKKIPCDDCLVLASCRNKPYGKLINECTLISEDIFLYSCQEADKRRDHFFERILLIENIMQPSEWRVNVEELCVEETDPPITTSYKHISTFKYRRIK